MNALADIYFYNAINLATELRDGTVSEARAVKHLIAGIILGGIGFEMPISIEFQDTTSSFGQFVIYLAVFVTTGIISYYGVWLTHQVNNKGDGKDYFLRFAALTLPIGVQLVVLFSGVGLLLMLLVMAVASQLGSLGVYLAEVIVYLLVIAFTAMFFLRMRKYIAVASGVNE